VSVGGRHNLHFDGGGFLYLVAVMDWVSRYVLAWRLSNLFDTSFRVDAVEEGATRDLQHRPGQSVHRRRLHCGCAHTSVASSLDGRGRFSDNIFASGSRAASSAKRSISRLMRSVAEPRKAISAYLEFYNTERLHQALDYRAPRQVFEERVPLASSRREKPLLRTTHRRNNES
jgi:putative transposase